MEHVEVLERLRGVLEHGKMGDKCLIAPDLVTAAIASLSAPQPPAEAQPVACAHEAWEESAGWNRCVDCGHGWATSPPSAPVGVEVKVLARDVHYAIRDAGLAPESPADDAAMRDAILRTLARQPAAVDGSLRAAVLKWWAEHQYDTDSHPEDGERNVYSEPPEFVRIAQQQ